MQLTFTNKNVKILLTWKHEMMKTKRTQGKTGKGDMICLFEDTFTVAFEIKHEGMIVNNELGEMYKEAVVTYFKVFSWESCGNYKIYQSGQATARPSVETWASKFRNSSMIAKQHAATSSEKNYNFNVYCSLGASVGKKEHQEYTRTTEYPCVRNSV
jgi:hypothetical protein